VIAPPRGPEVVEADFWDAHATSRLAAAAIHAVDSRKTEDGATLAFMGTLMIKFESGCD
jgi:hypothetical protein